MSVGVRVRGARTAAGLSQQQLADAVGVSKNAISKYERDDAMPTSAVLVRLAQSLGVRVSYLLHPPTVSIACPAYRSHAALPAKRRQQIEAQVLQHVERYLEVESAFGPERFPRHSLSMDRRLPIESPEAAERAAAALRTAWNLGLDPIPNVCETLEDHGVKVLFLADRDRRFSGWSCWANESVPVVVANNDPEVVQPARLRFTQLHEACHALYQLPDDHVLAEKIADRFAGAFLLPEEAVKAELGERVSSVSLPVLFLLRRKWGASIGCWISRMSAVGVLPPSARKSAWIAYSKAGYRKQEPSDDEMEPERSERFDRLLQQAWSEGLLTEARLCELMGWPLQALPEDLSKVTGEPSDETADHR